MYILFVWNFFSNFFKNKIFNMLCLWKFRPIFVNFRNLTKAISSRIWFRPHLFDSTYHFSRIADGNMAVFRNFQKNGFRNRIFQKCCPAILKIFLDSARRTLNPKIFWEFFENSFKSWIFNVRKFRPIFDNFRNFDISLIDFDLTEINFGLRFFYSSYYFSNIFSWNMAIFRIKKMVSRWTYQICCFWTLHKL